MWRNPMNDYSLGSLEALRYAREVLERETSVETMRKEIDRAVDLLLQGAGRNFRRQLEAIS